MTADGLSGANGSTTGVRIRPPFLLLGGIALGFVMDHVLPLPRVIPRDDSLLHKLIPTLILLVGFAIAAIAIRNFMRSSTPVPSTQPTRVLVTTGIHAWSRNPIYLGMLLLYVGIGVAVRSPWILTFALPIMLIVRFAVVSKEEAYLELHFGEEYRTYKSRVRRWL